MSIVSRGTRRPCKRLPPSPLSSQATERERRESYCPPLVRKRPCQRPSASACLRALSLKSAILEFLLLLLAAAATTAAAEAVSAREAMGSPKGGGGNIRYGACAAR